MSEASLKQRLTAVLRAQAGAGARGRLWPESAALEVERWRLVAALVAARPFATPDYLPRSEQWRRATAVLRDAAPCPALLDWLLLQVEVAANLEKGVRDMRPRRDGPCHGLALAYARQRLRKAEVVQAWVDSAVATDADTMRGASAVFAGRDAEDDCGAERQ